jgi:hypothetical protein
MTLDRLQTAFPDLTREVLAQVLETLQGTRSPFEVPQVDAWRMQCYHEPKERAPETIMRAVDVLLGGYGTEAIWGSDPYWPVAEYSNQGDTYATTILYDRMARKYRITTWGDWVETYGERYQVA